jgi:hypothetical protein
MVVGRQSRRVSSAAGIAIGPILFVVAILGILAAAIAASSGSFTGSSAREGSRTQASAMIEIGTLLKIGFTRLIGNGIDFDAIVIDNTATTMDVDLFSPSGGSVTNIPSVTLAADPATDLWYYPLGVLPQIGSGGSDRLALLRVSLLTCTQINQQANGVSVLATDPSMGADIGDPSVSPLTGAASWPAPLVGKEVGCLRNTNTTRPGYMFFQVLGIR